MSNIYKTILFTTFNTSKLITAIFLFISLFGARGEKEEKQSYKKSFVYIIIGLVMYFPSDYIILANYSFKTYTHL